MDFEIRYLHNGNMVHLERELDIGYLVREIMEYGHEDGERVTELGKIFFIDKVYKTFPATKVAKELEELKLQRDKVIDETTSAKKELQGIQKLREEEKGLLSKAMKLSGFKLLYAYINGEFTHWVTNYFQVKVLPIMPRLEVTIDNGTVKVKVSDVWVDIETNLCKTEAEAKIKLKTLYIESVKKQTSIYNLKNLRSDDLKNDSDAKFVYDTKLIELENKEKQEKIKQIKENIKTQEENLKKLE